MGMPAADSASDQAHGQQELSVLKAGHGQTYFDIIIAIIAGHPNIHLLEAQWVRSPAFLFVFCISPKFGKQGFHTRCYFRVVLNYIGAFFRIFI